MVSVFLYNRDATYIEEIVAVLRDLNLEVRAIEANSEIVFNLVPSALQRGAKSWLIFFLPNKQHELLILPFPDENHLQRLRNHADFQGYLADLIPTVNEYLTLARGDFYVPLDWIGRFQYILHDSSLDSLLAEAFDEPSSQSDVEIQRTFLRASQNIQQHRSVALSEALRASPIFVDSLVDSLDEVFVEENDNIFEYLQTTRGHVEVVPSIVRDFADIIDDETKRFLITSETVKKFADNYSLSNFDYSAPGCGLWKAVELEMNLSLVLHLRRERDIVADVRHPWAGGADRSGIYIPTGPRQNVNLNQRNRHHPNDLQSITLGPMNYMLKSGKHNGIKRDLQSLLRSNRTMLGYLLGQGANSLHRHLDKIIELRNGHAHISAMSHERFETLRNLVLPSDSNSGTCLVKILQLKRRVFGL